MAGTVADTAFDPSLEARARRLALQDHLLWLILSLLVLTSSALLAIDDAGCLHEPLFGNRIGGVCVWKNVTGVDCPGCGLTRCFVCLAHGRLAEAWRLHPVGVGLFGLVAVQVPYRLAQIRRLRQGRLPLAIPGTSAGLAVLAVALLGWWVIKLLLVPLTP